MDEELDAEAGFRAVGAVAREVRPSATPSLMLKARRSPHRHPHAYDAHAAVQPGMQLTSRVDDLLRLSLRNSLAARWIILVWVWLQHLEGDTEHGPVIRQPPAETRAPETATSPPASQPRAAPLQYQQQEQQREQTFAAAPLHRPVQVTVTR